MRPRSASACVLVAAFACAVGAATACILNPQPQPPLSSPSSTNGAEPSADASAGGTFHLGVDAGAQVDAASETPAPLAAVDASGRPAADTDAGATSEDAAPADDADAPGEDAAGDSNAACDADAARTFEPRSFP